MSTGTLFDLGGGPAPAPAPSTKASKASAAPRGGRRKTAAITPTSQPRASAIHPAARAALPPIDPDDTSFYALGRRLLRMSRAELDALDAKHRAAGYCRPPSPDALAGAISACAPRERPAGPWVTCECGSEMLADHMAEHMAIAAHAAAAKPDANGDLPFSLHNTFMAQRASRAGAP